MFESIFNYVFILIPIAIFVGRIVTQAKAKRSPPPPRSAPRIPVHFEDDDDENSVKVIGKEALAKNTKLKEIFPKEIFPKEIFPKEVVPTEALPPVKAALEVPVARQPPSAKKQEKPGLNLGNLSPLKQAVVMAEILGPPKAFQ